MVVDHSLAVTSTAVQSGFSRSYRFYPIYMQAFIKSFVYTLYNLALPNYLLFQLNISTDVLGMLTAIYALAYIIGPFLAKPISSRIGTRNATLIAAIISVTSVGIILITPNPSIIFICRLIDGLGLGFFWPNMYNQISQWESVSSQEKSKEIFKKFSLNWNIGCLASEIIGFGIVYLGKNDFIALIIAWIIMIAQIPAALLTEKKTTTLVYQNNSAIAIPELCTTHRIPGVNHSDHTNHSDHPDHSEADANNDPNSVLMRFSIIIALGGISFFCISKALTLFTYPLYLKELGQDSSLVYFMMFGQQFLQLYCVTAIGLKTPRIKYWAYVSSLIIGIIGAVIVLLNNDMIVVTLIMILFGGIAGTVYTFGSQIMLEYGKQRKTSKYSVMFETFSGIGSGITPLIAGIIALIDFRSNYIYLAILMGIYLLYTILSTAQARQAISKQP